MKSILLIFALFLVVETTFAQSTQATPGMLQATLLGGTGTKPVFTDNTGTLVKSAGTFYKTFPAADFDVTQISGTGGNYTGTTKFFVGGEIYSTGSNKLVAPIYLPLNNNLTNIKISKMTMCVLDNSNFSDLQMTAYEVFSSIGQVALTRTTIATVQSTGIDPKYRCFSTSNLSYLVDYPNNSYYLELSPKAGAVGTGGDIWDPQSKSQTLVHVIIEYNYN